MAAYFVSYKYMSTHTHTHTHTRRQIGHRAERRKFEKKKYAKLQERYG